MMVMFLCVVAYAVLIASDFLKLYQKSKLSLVCFISGIALLTACFVLVASTCNIVLVFEKRPIFSYAMAIFAGSFLFLFLRSLFVVVPIKETHSSSSKLKLVDTGMYALCRHPGVIWLTLYFLFSWLFVDNIMMLWLTIASTVLDIIYVIIQDLYIFPKTIENYDEYKKYTPFIIPSIESIKKVFKIQRQKNIRKKR